MVEFLIDRLFDRIGYEKGDRETQRERERERERRRENRRARPARITLTRLNESTPTDRHSPLRVAQIFLIVIPSLFCDAESAAVHR